MVTGRTPRPRRSPASPTVAVPEGPNALELTFVSDLHPEAVDYVLVAAETMLRHRCGQDKWNPYTKGGPIGAEKIISGFCDHVANIDWFGWKIMLNVVRDIGLADPRWYGVTDPVAERYCVRCRKVKPIEEFRGESLRCRSCEG